MSKNMETINQFIDRIYTNFTKDTVLVFPSKRALKPDVISTPDKWTVQQARDYIKYLENENEN